jgi:hypothetical protein
MCKNGMIGSKSGMLIAINIPQLEIFDSITLRYSSRKRTFLKKAKCLTIFIPGIPVYS